MITTLIYSLFALDQTLTGLAAQHSAWLFLALFIVIFAETGFVVFPLLPAIRCCSSPAPSRRRAGSTSICSSLRSLRRPCWATR